MIAHDAGVAEESRKTSDEAPAVTFEQLRGFKQLQRIAGLLSNLHAVGCTRDKSNNRELHFDDYVLLLLLYLFNPLIDSMRTLQKVSELPEVQKRLNIKRFSLGSFSESCRVFEPQMLQQVVDQLAGGLLWNDIKAKGSSYVCRVRDNSAYAEIENRPLDQAAKDAGIISDQIVEIGLSKKPNELANHPTRLICIRCAPHQKRGKGKRHGVGQTGPTSDGVLRIVTDLLDVPAQVIAFLYEYRWMIEVFFRFFKQTLGCRHLLSTKIEGIQIQVYAAVICCLLLNTLTGRKPSKWMVTLMALYLQGLATDEDVLRELNKPDNTGVKLRAKDELWKKLGY